MNSSVAMTNLADTVLNDRSVSRSTDHGGSTDASSRWRVRTRRSHVTSPLNQSGSSSLLRPDAP